MSRRQLQWTSVPGDIADVEVLNVAIENLLTLGDGDGFLGLGWVWDGAIWETGKKKC